MRVGEEVVCACVCVCVYLCECERGREEAGEMVLFDKDRRK